jgi:hypothetical protein
MGNPAKKDNQTWAIERRKTIKYGQSSEERQSNMGNPAKKDNQTWAIQRRKTIKHGQSSDTSETENKTLNEDN